MKSALLALIINSKDNTLVETLAEDHEISLFETEVAQGDPNPLPKILHLRTVQAKEEEEFGDYVEELLSQPFLRKEIQEHALQWLRSKIRIEQYQKSEQEAAKVISDYALELFRNDPEKTDFFLVGPTHRVRVRIFVVDAGVRRQVA